MRLPGFARQELAGPGSSVIVPAANPPCPVIGMGYRECVVDCITTCHEFGAKGYASCMSGCPGKCAGCPHIPLPALIGGPLPPLNLSNFHTSRSTEDSSRDCFPYQYDSGYRWPSDDGEAFIDCSVSEECRGGTCAPAPEGGDAVACFLTSTMCRPTTCTHFDGPCTGSHVWFDAPAPTRCISAGGTVQCCGGWYQYPWVKACADGTRTQGCGFCVA
jgi:hypothetical protein